MRITVKLKLAATFGVIIALSAVTTVVAINSLASMGEKMDFLVEKAGRRVALASQINEAVLHAVKAEKNLILADTAEVRNRFDAEIVKSREELKRYRASLWELSSADGRKRIEGFDAAWEKYLIIQDKVRELAKADTSGKARVLANGDGVTAFTPMVEAIKGLADRVESAANVDRLRAAAAASRIQSMVFAIQRDLRNMMVSEDQGDIDRFGRTTDEDIAEFRRRRDVLRRVAGEEERAAVENFVERSDKWLKISEDVRAIARENSSARAFELSSVQGRQLVEQADAILEAIKDLNEKQMADEKAAADAAYAFNRALLISLLIGSLLIAAITASYIAISISKGLAKAVALANAVAIGDLGQSVSVTTSDEVRDMIDALNNMVGNLRTTAGVAEAIAGGDLTVQSKRLSDKDTLGIALEIMLDKLRTVVTDAASAADNVSSGSQQLSATSEEMSQGSTEQAASTEEASASMEQMAANIKQNAENASQTEKISRQSAKDAQASGEAVNRAVAAMQTIAEKITIVQEIARQTDLLALNAAVEAARAGEHGKGFAVVASEVRKLAERSQAAAAEINSLSGETVKVAAEAGEMLGRLVPDIKKTAELVEEITAACREQDIGADQINQAIQQLDKVTQQNSSASEQMAATSEELAAQAEQLQSVIAYFRVDDHATQRKPGRKEPARAAIAHIGAAQVPKRPAAAPARAGAKKGNGIAKPGFAFDMGKGADAQDADYQAY